MLKSHVITIDGTLVGAAIRLDVGYRFVAIDMRVEDLDTRIFPTLEDVQRLARRLYRTGSYVAPSIESAAAVGGIVS